MNSAAITVASFCVFASPPDIQLNVLNTGWEVFSPSVDAYWRCPYFTCHDLH